MPPSSVITRKSLLDLLEKKKSRYYEENGRQPKMMMSFVKVGKLNANGCAGYLASVVGKPIEEKLKPKDVQGIREYIKDFLKRITRFASRSSNNIQD